MTATAKRTIGFKVLFSAFILLFALLGLSQSSFAENTNDKQRVRSMAEFNTLLNRCKENGYYDLILNSVTVADPRIFLSIMVRESGCDPTHGPRSDSGAFGPFQILAKHLDVFSQNRNIISTAEGLPARSRTLTAEQKFRIAKAAERMQHIMRCPKVNDPSCNCPPEGCGIVNIRAAEQIYRDGLNYFNRGDVGAQCYYAWQMTNYIKDNNYDHCHASVENEIYVSYLNGVDIRSKIASNIDQPDYSNNEVQVNGKTYSVLTCQDRTQTLAQALAKASRTYRLQSAAITQETFYEDIQREKESGRKNHRGEIKQAYCIDNILGYFDLIRALLAGAEWIEALIGQIVEQVLDAICNWAAEAIVGGVESLLNSVCIPLPNISFELDLEGLQRESCNGWSLGEAIAVGTGGMSASDVMSGMNSALPDTGYTQLTPILSTRMESPDLMYPLRRFFGLTPEGNEDVH